MLVHQSLNMQSFNGSQYFFNQHACRKADAYNSTSTAMDLKDDIGSLLWRGESISQFHLIYPRGRGGTGLILQSASAAVANLSRPCSRHPPRRPIICVCECESERERDTPASPDWLLCYDNTTTIYKHHIRKTLIFNKNMLHQWYGVCYRVSPCKQTVNIPASAYLWCQNGPPVGLFLLSGKKIALGEKKHAFVVQTCMPCGTFSLIKCLFCLSYVTAERFTHSASVRSLQPSLEISTLD